MRGSAARGRIPVRTLLAIGGLALLTPSFVPAQDVTEPALKAAFIQNFIGFTEWPADTLAPNTPLAACVVADNALADELQREVRGRTLNTHTVVVNRSPTLAGLPRGCNLLYVGGGLLPPAVQATQGVKDTPVLTMSDIDGFAQGGGLAQFYFEHSKLKFIINMGTLKRTRLTMSAKLLSLAKRI